jgi:hypothetical protein
VWGAYPFARHSLNIFRAHSRAPTPVNTSAMCDGSRVSRFDCAAADLQGRTRQRVGCGLAVPRDWIGGLERGDNADKRQRLGHVVSCALSVLVSLARSFGASRRRISG